MMGQPFSTAGNDNPGRLSNSGILAGHILHPNLGVSTGFVLGSRYVADQQRSHIPCRIDDLQS